MDIELYESIVRKCTPPLYRYCSYRLAFNHQLAEEAVNDTMRILFIKWDTLDITDDILRYLYRVADNCIKQARERDSKYYSMHTSFEEAIEEGIVDEPMYTDDYFHDPVEEEKFIRETLQTLSEEYQIIFRYICVERKTIMETVDLTGIPYSTLRIRLAKIEEYIKRQVKNNY